MSERYNITEDTLRADGFRPIHAGDSYDFPFTLMQNGGWIDLTNGKVWFTVKESTVEADAAAKLQLTSADTDEIEITAPTLGNFTVKFRSPATDNIAGLWEYDIQVKQADGTIITVAIGKIEFLENLTRSTT